LIQTQMLVDEAIEKLQSEVNDTAIIACSGGIDSSVAAVLAHRAVGSLLHCVYVDTGFMRKNESEEVAEMFAEMGIALKVVNASKRFFSNLEGVTDPEEKRKVIGEQFIRVFEEEQKLCGAKYLVQGTIAPDWIESGGGERDVIKSHHNVGGLPEDVDLEIVEPLREFYKDEVRAIARELNIKSSERQPFPGPGLAVRVLGDLTESRVEACREACHIVEKRLQEAAAAGKCDLPWQYFAALLPVRSVGVHGDARVHGETVVVRAVTSIDGMSAKFSPIPHDVLASISTEITNALKGQVNRVVYDITHKPPGTIEWE
jgi:GMP synthase (glutamine-hydrolysing)